MFNLVFFSVLFPTNETKPTISSNLRSPVSAIHAHVQHYIGNVFLFLYGEHFLTLGATFFLWRDFFFSGATFFRRRDFSGAHL